VYFFFLCSLAPIRVGPLGFTSTKSRTSVEAGGGIGGGKGSLGIGWGRMCVDQLLQ
jgi:hypothetical protein